MPDKYQIILGIENSQADAAARASTKLMQAYERQCLAAAKAAQAALHGGNVRGTSGATVPSAVSQAQAAANAQTQVTAAAAKGSRTRVSIAEQEARSVERIAERQAARLAAITARIRASVAALPEVTGGEVSTGHFFRGRSSSAQDAAVRARYAAASNAAKAAGLTTKEYIAKHTAVERVRIADVLAGQDTLEKAGLHHYADPASLRAKQVAGELPAVDVLGRARIAADGHHRLAAMAAAGQKYADVMVTRLPPPPKAPTAAGPAGGGAPRIDVGYYKAAMEGIKLQDRQVAAAKKKADEITAIEDKFYLKDYQAKVKAADAKAQADTKAAARAVQEAEKKAVQVQSLESKYLAKDYQDRVKAEKKKQQIDDLARSRTEKAIKDLEGLEESYRVRDYKARVAQEKRKEALEGGPAANAAKYRRKALDDEQAHAVAVNRITDVQNKRKVEGIAKVMGEQRLSFAEAINSALGLDSALSKVGIAMAGLAAGRSIVLGISGAFIEARENAKKFATTTLDFMVQLRPLASVMGVAPTFEFAKKVAQFGAETGMGKAGAASFLESFAGRAQITRGKQISEPEYEKFTTVAGKMTTARGIPTDIAGDLFASVLKIENFLKKGQGADEAMARAGALFDILDAGSGKIAQLAPQAQQLMASLASENELEGVFKTAGEVGVVTSLMAENIPGEAAVFGRSLVKAYGTFDDKDRQPFYKRAGIVPGMSALERIRKANLVIGEEVGKGRSLEEVVRGFGLAGNVREKTAVETAYKARDTVLKPQLERLAAAEKPGGVAAVQAQLDKRFRDKDILYTQAQAAVEAADILPEGLSAEIYRKRAEEQLKKERFETDPLQFAKQKLAAVASFGRKAGRDVAIEARAISMARQEAGLSPYVSLGEAVYGNTDETINSLIRARGNRPGLVGPGGGAPAALPQAQPANDPVLLQLKRIADSNERMENRDKDRQSQAPPALDVKGPAQLSGRG